jgi:CSLREA domain-containing protein
MATRMATRLGVAVVLGSTVALLAASPAFGAVITPNTFGDENGGGPGCSLREAILAANNDAAFGGCPPGTGADTIPLADGTYRLSIPLGTPGDDGDLDVSSQLTIAHAGVAPAVIDGGGVDRVIHLLGGASLTGSGFAIRNGRTAQSGGGVRNEGSLDLSDVTVSGNETTASFGGGIANSGTATMSLTNVTVSGNGAEGDGGGIDQGVGGQLNLNSVTIAGNTTDTDGDTGGGGGIFNAGGAINLRNTIIARNRDNTSAPIPDSPDCGGAAYTSGRNNLIGDLTGCNFVAAGGDETNVNPRLGPLANNGGPAFTHALLAGSPAIEAGGGDAAPTDQRGVPRRVPDIGAYEFATCAGRVVNRVGTSGNDKLVGTSGADGILGLGGRDILKGHAAKDGLCGGFGRDKLHGHRGKDTLIGGKGKDVCKGGPGKDVEKSC